MLSFINGVKIMQITRTVEMTAFTTCMDDNLEVDSDVITMRDQSNRDV